MIESGLVSLIQAGLGSPPIALGFAVQLPENQINAASPKAWLYKSITSTPNYTLDGQDGWTCWHVEIQAHGNTMTDAITLARAIDGVLRGGYSGTLSDSDSTVVQGIFRLPGLVDGFSDLDHSFVRTLEYEIVYQQI